MKVGKLKRNKASPLYAIESPACAAAAGPDGHSVIVGHLDGSIYRFTFDHNDVPASHVRIPLPRVSGHDVALFR